MLELNRQEFDLGSVALHNLKLKLRSPVSPYSTSCDKGAGGSILSMLLLKQQEKSNMSQRIAISDACCDTASAVDDKEAMYAEWRAASNVFFGKVSNTNPSASASPLVETLAENIRRCRDVVVKASGNPQQPYTPNTPNTSYILPDQVGNPEEISPHNYSQSQNYKKSDLEESNSIQLKREDDKHDTSVVVNNENNTSTISTNHSLISGAPFSNNTTISQIPLMSMIAPCTSNLLSSQGNTASPSRVISPKELPISHTWHGTLHSSNELSHSMKPLDNDAKKGYVTVGVQCTQDMEAFLHEGNNITLDTKSSERCAKYHYDAATAHLPIVELYGPRIDEMERRIRDEVQNAVNLQVKGAGFPLGLPSASHVPNGGVSKQYNTNGVREGIYNGPNGHPSNNIDKGQDGSYARDAEIAAIRDSMARDLYSLKDQIAILNNKLLMSQEYHSTSHTFGHHGSDNRINHHNSRPSSASQDRCHSSVSQSSSHGTKGIPDRSPHIAIVYNNGSKECTPSHRKITVEVVRDHDISPKPYPKPKRKDANINTHPVERIDMKSNTSSIKYESDFTDVGSDEMSISPVRELQHYSDTRSMSIVTSSSFRSTASFISDNTTVYDD